MLHRPNIYGHGLTTFTSYNRSEIYLSDLDQDNLLQGFWVPSITFLSENLIREYFPILNPRTIGSEAQNFTFQLVVKFHLFCCYFSFRDFGYQGSPAPPTKMNFLKSFKRPLTPLPLFFKKIFQIFGETSTFAQR